MRTPKSARVWDLPTEADLDRANVLASALDLPQTAAQVLVRRGIDDRAEASRFLNVGPADLLDPFLLAECREAAERVRRAIDQGEKIVVHGDYDADGICGTALLTRGLSKFGANVQPFLPDRQKDGYGVADRLVDHAVDRGVGVLITVDTGSTASEQLARAAAAGIDVIVCDHHRFSGRPEGVGWFLNPLREDSGYPHSTLCGAGVAQKLLCAVHRLAGMGDQPGLDLAAIATVADQVPLERENRAIVAAGLELLSTAPDPGLSALLNVCRIDSHRLDATDVAFQIAPRINAAGRIGSARTALDLILASGPAEAQRLASELDRLNTERKSLDEAVTVDAIARASRLVEADDPAGIVVWSEEWHRGVVGISAAKVVAEFGRPAILFACEGEVAVGSARSVPGLDLKAALDDCAPLLERYGGHAAAAGATIDVEQLPALREEFAGAVSKAHRDESPATHYVDAVLQPGELDPRLARFLYALGPFGNGNPAPRFATRSASQSVAPRLIKDRHVRLGLRNGPDEISVIGFGRAEAWLPMASEAGNLDVSFGLRHRPGSRWSEWECIGDEIRVPEEGLA